MTNVNAFGWNGATRSGTAMPAVKAKKAPPANGGEFVELIERRGAIDPARNPHGPHMIRPMATVYSQVSSSR